MFKQSTTLCGVFQIGPPAVPAADSLSYDTIDEATFVKTLEEVYIVEKVLFFLTFLLYLDNAKWFK